MWEKGGMRYISIEGKELVNGIRTRNERAATRSVVLFILYWDPRMSYVVSDLGKWRKKMYNPPQPQQVAVNQLTTRHCVYRTLSHLPT